MRTGGASALSPVASRNGSAPDRSMQKRWMATMPLAEVRSSAHNTRPLPIGSPSTAYSCSCCTQKKSPSLTSRSGSIAALSARSASIIAAGGTPAASVDAVSDPTTTPQACSLRITGRWLCDCACSEPLPGGRPAATSLSSGRNGLSRRCKATESCGKRALPASLDQLQPPERTPPRNDYCRQCRQPRQPPDHRSPRASQSCCRSQVSPSRAADRILAFSSSQMASPSKLLRQLEQARRNWIPHYRICLSAHFGGEASIAQRLSEEKLRRRRRFFRSLFGRARTISTGRISI